MLFISLCGIVISYFLLIILTNAWPRYNKNGTDKGTARIGILKSIQYIAMFFLHPSYFRRANYELSLYIHKLHGSVFIMNIPPLFKVMASIADLNVAKQIMSSPDWTDRFKEDYYLQSPSPNKPLGLFFGSGEHWKQSRILTLRLLHQLNFFKGDTLDRLTLVEMNEAESTILKAIEDSGKGEATLCTRLMFTKHTLNIVMQVILGQRFEGDDVDIKNVKEASEVFNREFNAGFSVLEGAPWLKFVPGFTYYRSFRRASVAAVDFFTKIIQERRKKGTYLTNPKDFTDYFLQEIDSHANDKNSAITEENFLISLRDMVWAGNDTSSSALEYAILYMALYPDIQAKVQDEIDQIMGQSRPPSFLDKSEMTYTQAVLNEIFRHATPVPLTSRTPRVDTYVGNDFIPKGSVVGINLYAIHRSKDVWEDPDEFRPERFLNESHEVINADKIIPFGYGKRNCFSESVARTTLFIFFVSLMQKFTFAPSTNHPPPSLLKNVAGLSRCPAPYYVQVKSRVV